LCITCLGLIYEGQTHTCRSIKDLNDVKKALSNRTIELCANDILKEKEEKGEKLTLASKGRPTPFLRVDKSLKRKLDRDDDHIHLDTVEMAKRATGISQNQMNQVVKIFRHDVKVESNVKKHLTDLNNRHKDLFSIENIALNEVSESFAPVIYCTNVPLLIDRLLDYRQSSREEVFLRLSIDEGQSFLKVSASLVFKDPTVEANDLFKSSGVKRTFILAVSPIKETYSSVSLLMSKINLETLPSDLDFVFTQDLKCFNLVFGLMGHMSKHPCFLCN
jgi:hypothetical protein